MTFDIGTELAVSVNSSSLSSARSTIEQELQDVSVSVDDSGIGGQLAPDGGSSTGPAIVDAITEQTDVLLDVQDTLEQSAVSAGGGIFGGGGGGGSLLPSGSGEVGLGIGIGSLLTGGKSKLSTLISKVPFKSLLSRIPSLTGLLGSVSAGALINPLSGSLVALLGGTLALGDLLDGDISPLNLPAKFGRALGKGFGRVFPEISNKIKSAFTNNPFFDAGGAVGDLFTGAASNTTNPARGVTDSTAPDALPPGPNRGINSREELLGFINSTKGQPLTGSQLEEVTSQPTAGQRSQLSVDQSITITDDRDIREELDSAVEEVTQEIEKVLDVGLGF